jgi:hypothetical protein
VNFCLPSTLVVDDAKSTNTNFISFFYYFTFAVGKSNAMIHLILERGSNQTAMLRDLLLRVRRATFSMSTATTTILNQMVNRSVEESQKRSHAMLTHHVIPPVTLSQRNARTVSIQRNSMGETKILTMQVQIAENHLESVPTNKA